MREHKMYILTEINIIFNLIKFSYIKFFPYRSASSSFTALYFIYNEIFFHSIDSN